MNMDGPDLLAPVTVNSFVMAIDVCKSAGLRFKYEQVPEGEAVNAFVFSTTRWVFDRGGV